MDNGGQRMLERYFGRSIEGQVRSFLEKHDYACNRSHASGVMPPQSQDAFLSEAKKLCRLLRIAPPLDPLLETYWRLCPEEDTYVRYAGCLFPLVTPQGAPSVAPLSELSVLQSVPFFGLIFLNILQHIQSCGHQDLFQNEKVLASGLPALPLPHLGDATLSKKKTIPALLRCNVASVRNRSSVLFLDEVRSDETVYAFVMAP